MAVRDGQSADVVLPKEYTLYRWRRIMKVDPITALNTPISDILLDMEMIGLEEQYGKQPDTSANNKK